jgi:hypothetical protein
VKPVGQRQNANQQNLSKRTFKQRKKNKKKKEDQKIMRTSYRGTATGNSYGLRPAEKKKTLKDPMPKRKIDIRV